MNFFGQRWVWIGMSLICTLNAVSAYALVFYWGWSPLAFSASAVLSTLLIAWAYVWHSYRVWKTHASTRNLNQSLQDALRELHQQKDTEYKELQVARKVHEGLLSLSDPQIPGILIASRCLPAQSLGGDFYAFLDRRGESLIKKSAQVGIVEYRGKEETTLGVIVGDVAGHGVSSALVMALSNGLMTEMSKATRSPAHLLAQANERIHHYIHASAIKYVTAFYGTLSVEAGKLRFAKAGYVCPFLIRADGTPVILEAEGIFLGMYPGETYDEKEVDLMPGDRLVLFTDGMTEVRNSNSEMFGEERLKDCLLGCRHLSVQAAVDFVFNTINTFSQHLPARDDQTLILIDYRPASASLPA